MSIKHGRHGKEWELVNFWCWCGSACAFWITVPFYHRGIRHLGHFLPFLKQLQTGQFLPNLWRNDWRRQGSDPVHIRIWIRISTEIWIRISDHFRLTLRPWWSLRSVGVLVMNIERMQRVEWMRQLRVWVHYAIVDITYLERRIHCILSSDFSFN